MKRTRRDFIETSTAAGALLGAAGASALSAAQSQSRIVLPTPRAKALMSLFDLKYPIFQAPHGRATSPELAIAVSNAGAVGALASLQSPNDARDTVSKVRAATKGYFVINYLLWCGTASLSAALASISTDNILITPVAIGNALGRSRVAL